MAQFSEWFIDTFKIYFKEIGSALKDFFIGLYYLIIGNFINHFRDFLRVSGSFTSTDWLIAIPSMLVVILLYAAIIALIVQLLRR